VTTIVYIGEGGEIPMRKHWKPMKLTSVGHISKVVQAGGGKLSAAGGDPGESRKQKPTG
jgi:hypothetical protein